MPFRRVYAYKTSQGPDPQLPTFQTRATHIAPGPTRTAMDPTLYKKTTVPRGFTYHYYYSPAAPGKPTLLFLHSFPTSSYEWHRQVEHFQPQGYGIFAPDYLGCGESSKPDNVEAYTFVALGHDIVYLLDVAQVDTVVGIGHVW